MRSELIKPAHLARKAVVYIRQSTPQQVVTNQESLRLQYALRQRARELGWHEADMDIIDADLGMSGASAAQRGGFKELVGRVGLSEVGPILSIDVTRLARNCSDWYPLLDICGLRNCLIADRDGVYDPGNANGRLLLGLKGTISELELHTIRSRLTAGLLAKAQRGELALMEPSGLVRDPAGVVVKDPDIEVQERLDLVFQTFLKVRTVAKTVRTLNGRDLDLPRRDRHGDARWTRATLAAVASVLKNSTYAGAFVYGRTRTDPGQSESAKSAKKPRPLDAWRIVVKDRYPAYIDWATYEKIRASSATIEPNICQPRREAFLEKANFFCTASSGAGAADTKCTRAVRAAPNMSAITCALNIRRCQPANICARRASMLPYPRRSSRRWRRPNSTHSQELAAPSSRSGRRFGSAPNGNSSVSAMPRVSGVPVHRVDPDNRLVAAELERRWERALNDVREAEAAMARQAAPQTAGLTVGRALHDKMVMLTGRLPQIWTADSTTDACGRLVIDRQSTGAYLFENATSVVQAVQDLREHRVRQVDLRISQAQQEGYQHA